MRKVALKELELREGEYVYGLLVHTTHNTRFYCVHCTLYYYHPVHRNTLHAASHCIVVDRKSETK